jgi:hypothetical protein
VLKRDPPKWLGCRETSRSSGHAVRSLRLRGASPPRKWRERAGNARGVGYTQFVWVADIGWTHRASSSPAGRKARWCRRALARKKSVAPPDAGRGWAEGESVRVFRIPKQVSCSRPAGLSLAGARHDERRSRAYARLALTGKPKQGPLTRRSTSTSPSARNGEPGQHVGRYGFRLGCACG